MENPPADPMSAMPYPSSWVDRLIAWIARLPGPAWVFYVTLVAALMLISQALRWLDGSLPVGTYDLARLAEAPFPVYFLALMQWLNATARQSLEGFRPALAVSDSEFARLQYELTVLPRTTGIVCLLAGALFAAISVSDSPAGYGVGGNTSAFTSVYSVLFLAVTMAFYLLFLVHTVRQLRLVNRIHRMATNINLFHSIPVYAFSALTVRSAIGIIIVVYYNTYLTYTLQIFGPVPGMSAFNIGTLGLVLLIAAASFVLPLNGMHRRLVQEKEKLVGEAERRFEATLARLHERVDQDNFEKMDDLNKALASLVIEREALAKISTWPWRPETLRGLLTLIALPVLLWLLTSYLGRILGL